ncbi:hypothetical protein GE061_014406 [Apolygus lucorum]|uniref:Uncharacterized protein n=1 Tax=Apolygus lucorum TaxID=248454 RepID=A0A8S9XRU7_APOLU|nr:hypothetical protein GE061_014406 [Apolygus lucorum]
MWNIKQILLSAILVIFLDDSSGLSAEEYKAVLLTARKYCNESQVDPATLTMIRETEIIKDRDMITPEATCFLDCILKRTGLVINDKLEVESVIEVINHIGYNEEHQRIGVETVTKCDAKRKIMPGKCNAGQYFKDCEHEFSQDLSFLHIILRT